MASSLLEKAKAQQAEKEREAQKAAAEKKRREAEEKLIGSHPVVKMGLGRDVQDAYFQGLVFAAFADDNKVDKDERGKLVRAAKTLAIGEEDVDRAIAALHELDDAAKLALGEDVAKTLGGTDCALLFLCEFSLMWMAHESYDQKSLCEWREQLANWGMPYPEKWFARFDKIVATVKDSPKSLLELEGKLSAEMIIHLFSGMVDDVARKLKAAKAAVDAAEKRHKEKQRQNELLKAVMDEVANEFCEKATFNIENLEYVSDKVNDIDAGMVDWVEHVKRILATRIKGHEKSRYILGYTAISEVVYVVPCRKAVWKVITLLLLVYGTDWYGTGMKSDAERLLSSRSMSDGDVWKGRLRDFINEYLGDYVTV